MKNFERYFDKTYHIINKLTRSGRKNLTVLSLLLVEGYFRPSYIRFLEYIYWILMLLLHSQKANDISLGFAQIKYKYWKMFCPSMDNWTRHIKEMTCVYANYDNCYSYLRYHYKDFEELGYSKILKTYNGHSTEYYCKLFRKSIELLKCYLKGGN